MNPAPAPGSGNAEAPGSGAVSLDPRARLALVLLFLAAFILRVAGNDWGIVAYRSPDPPPGVRGTVYTYFPDEREFLACFRALGSSLARVSGEEASGGFSLSGDAFGRAARGILSGEVTFAPEYPTAVSPLVSYLVFFAAVPVVMLKKLLGFYPGFDSNTVFAEALMVGRWLAAVFGVLVVGLTVRVLGLLGLRGAGLWTGAILATLLPIGVVVGHYCNYNAEATFFDLLALGAILRAAEPGSDRRFGRAGIAAGLAIATKLTAGPLLPILVVGAFLRTDRPWRGRIALAARGAAAAVGVYIAIILYSVVTQTAEMARAFHIYGFNIVGGAGAPSTPAMVASNYLLMVMPFCLSPLGWIAGLGALGWLVRRAASERAAFLHLLFVGTWLGLSLFNPNNMAYRMFTPAMLIVIAFARGVEALSLRRRTAALALAAVVALNQAVDTALITRFFLAEDVRETASRWVEREIPAGASIGNFYDMVYNYHPDILYTDYFWNRERVYRYRSKLALDKGGFPVDWIVTSRAELLKRDYARTPQAADIMDRAGFRRVAVFEPDLSLGPYRVPYESESMFALNLFVSRIEIYRREGGPSVLVGRPAADTSAPIGRSAEATTP